jgi:hypothetical protein
MESASEIAQSLKSLRNLHRLKLGELTQRSRRFAHRRSEEKN